MKEDEELEELLKLKKQLIAKSLKLKKTLTKQQSSKQEPQKVVHIDAKFSKQANQINSLLQREEFSQKLLDTNIKSSGILFKNVSKRFLKDDTWIYRAEVEMKVINFKIDVTVDRNNKNEILDINCLFVGVNAVYLDEVSSWTLEITRERNFSALMTTFCDYNDQANLRKKIVAKLKNENYITEVPAPKYIMFVHSPNNPKHYYMKVTWALEFDPVILSIEHLFTIETVDDDFIDAHKNIMKEFCLVGLKNNVDIQWSKLCEAIDNYNQLNHS